MLISLFVPCYAKTRVRRLRSDHVYWMACTIDFVKDLCAAVIGAGNGTANTAWLAQTTVKS